MTDTRTAATSDTLAAIDAWLERTADERLADYVDFLRIPTIGTLSEHADDMRRGAQFLVDRLNATGISAEVSETGGHPIVYGEWLGAPGAPTVVVYGHYDVQPVDPLDLWVRPPFEPRVEGGKIYARGAADDKGQVHLHLSAARAWLENHGRLPVNLKYVIEGEEESGSDHFDPWLEANAGRLAGDLVVVSDTGFYEGNEPAITIGLRGLIYTQIDVWGSEVDLHSGTYGGNVQNPANALAHIVAALKDSAGNITVPGFYDDVRPLTEREQAEFARMPLDEASFRAEHGLRELVGESDYSVLERRGARPTLDVNGMWSGFQGEGSKTIIPAHAHAKVSCRLVPDMDPARTFERLRDHVLAVAPAGVKVECNLLNAGMWSLVPIDHPATVAAAACLEEVFGAKPYFLREGGSIPAAASFARVLDLPVVLLGFTNPDDRAHAPNEVMYLANYEGGARTIARFWQRLAEMGG
jgi:acetylornithine deacetylase/succinyl-diaminopimelate desuccinylase-like protein